MRCNRILFLLLALLLIVSGCQRAEAAEEKGRFVDSLTFLGDSITAHMASRANVEENQLWCTRERYLNLDSRITYAKIVAPDTGHEERIAEVAARICPAYLVITLGIDYGVYYYRNELETFSLYYEKLLDAISAASPDTVLILQSIFPVTAACSPITNEMIDRANGAICAIAEKRGVYYLNTQEVLRDGNGYLRAEYCNSADGIHLSEAAYEVILQYIEERCEEIERK